jgi:hypothetical protein
MPAGDLIAAPSDFSSILADLITVILRGIGNQLRFVVSSRAPNICRANARSDDEVRRGRRTFLDVRLEALADTFVLVRGLRQ